MTPSSAERLSRRFYRRSSEVVAKALLGKHLVAGDRAGIIVETEAYLGSHDKASHARFGRTRRNAVMFGHGGVSYVYLCYGMYDLFNVVTGRDGDPQAVLIRALEPVRGIGGDVAVTRGPGKLTRALGITRSHSGLDMTGASTPVYIAPGRRISRTDISVGPRVGVDYAGDWASAPLRFWIAGHPSVSRGARSKAA